MLDINKLKAYSGNSDDWAVRYFDDTDRDNLLPFYHLIGKNRKGCHPITIFQIKNTMRGKYLFVTRGYCCYAKNERQVYNLISTYRE